MNSIKTSCVILDAGSRYMKAGFGGECFPRAFFSTVTGRDRHAGLTHAQPSLHFGDEAIKRRGNSNLIWPVRNGSIQDWNEMEKLWHYAFYSQLHTPPEEVEVLHVVSPLVSEDEKAKMAEILFESFAIRGLYIAKSPPLVLYASGRTTGIVWQDGAQCAHAEPVFEGFPLVHAVVTSDVTGELLTDVLQKKLDNIGYQLTTPVQRDLVDDLKAKLCYVSTDYEEDMKRTDSCVDYTLPDGQVITLGAERFTCPEVLFRPTLHNLTCPGVAEVIGKCVRNCDIDYQPQFWNNIVIAGGSTQFPGFEERLTLEMKLKTKIDFGTRINITALNNRHFGAWTGGSVFSCLSSMGDFWLSREKYEGDGMDAARYKFF